MTATHIEHSDSPYYSISGRLPLASRLSFHVRKKMFSLFMQVLQPSKDMSVLDLGVTGDTRAQESNYFEQFYPFRERIVCAGTERAGHLGEIFSGVKVVQLAPGSPLPFADGQFDIVFSNAVVEHTGSRSQQAAFVKEALRVGRRFFLTTPNRWFPVELHTGIPFLHFFHPGVYRSVLRWCGHQYFAKEENLNLLDRHSFRALFPGDAQVQIARVKLLGLTSNLVAYGVSNSNAAAISRVA
jgi:SAM-dependent methyltransferase